MLMGEEDGVLLVPLARMDAVSTRGQKIKYTSQLHLPSFLELRDSLGAHSRLSTLVSLPLLIAGSLLNHKVSPRDVKGTAQGHPGREQLW